MNDGLIYLDGKILIPSPLRQDVISDFHTSKIAGHRGIHSTLEKIRRDFTWPNLEADVRSFVLACHDCAQAKATTQPCAGPQVSIELPTRRFDQISVDFISKRPRSRSGKDMVLVVTDTATKFVELIPLQSSATSAHVADALLTRWALRGFGWPKEIISDRDPRFTSSVWKRLQELMTTKLKMSSAYHPQTDGQTERMIRTVNEYLRLFVGNAGKRWEELLPYAAFAINDSPTSTGMTPFIAVYGQHPNAGWSFLKARTNDKESLGAFITRMQTSTQRALQALSKARERHNKLVNIKRLPLQFKIGDQVYVKTTNLRKSMKGVDRFKPRWIGPVSIKRQLGTSFELDLSSYPDLSQVHPVFHSTLLRASKISPAEEVSSS